MKTKHIILTITLVFSSLLIKAQDKYDFMSIFYSETSEKITISINGKESIAEKPDLRKQEYNDLNLNPLFKKVEEYQSQDWEVMAFNALATGQNSNVLYHYAYLRKKKAL